ncbi:MAG: zinc ribbon domain-containing protein [Kouleothrix sp.]|nr:zinc ribbon domain-containing protein [Kouleothrix sp.]
MAEMIHCQRCGGDSPTDARFCIDCGAPLAAATTGPTTRLAGIACPACGTSNPEKAQFCVLCGRSIGGQPAPNAERAPVRLTPPRAPQPSAPRPAPRQSYPRVASPPTFVPHQPAPAPTHHHQRNHNPGAPVFLVGLALLLITGTLWPGILVLMGFSALVNQAARGRPTKGLTVMLWFGGLALLFMAGHSIWPGILVLMLLHAMLNGWGGSQRRHW